MTETPEPLCRQKLQRREDASEKVGPAVLELCVYGPDEGNGFELQELDEDGRVRYRFRDASRFQVMNEFAVTLSDLERFYERYENEGSES